MAKQRVNYTPPNTTPPPPPPPAKKTISISWGGFFKLAIAGVILFFLLSGKFEQFYKDYQLNKVKEENTKLQAKLEHARKKTEALKVSNGRIGLDPAVVEEIRDGCKKYDANMMSVISQYGWTLEDALNYISDCESRGYDCNQQSLRIAREVKGEYEGYLSEVRKYIADRVIYAIDNQVGGIKLELSENIIRNSEFMAENNILVNVEVTALNGTVKFQYDPKSKDLSQANAALKEELVQLYLLNWQQKDWAQRTRFTCWFFPAELKVEAEPLEGIEGDRFIPPPSPRGNR